MIFANLRCLSTCFVGLAWLAFFQGTQATVEYDPDVGFPIGIMGTFTTFSHSFVAVAVAFDLDLRKNFEPELQARFGPPIVDIENLHPSLKLKLQIGTSHSNPATGMRTALDWFLGNNGFHRAVGIVGGFFSSITMPVASNAAVFEVPQVAFGATNPNLSDKQRYPFFCRTVPPDTLTGASMWAWVEHFQVPSVAVFHSREAYAAALYESVYAKAALAGATARVKAVGIDFMLPELYDIEVTKEAIQRIKESGSRFVIMIMTFSEANPACAVLEQEGMLYSGTYQFLGSEFNIAPGRELSPSRGWPQGWFRINPVSTGALFPKFMEMWTKMTVEDVYSSEAYSRYMLDRMQEPFEQTSQFALEQEDFVVEFFEGSDWDVLTPNIFDAGYTFAIAINNLLNKDVEPSEIAGEVLLEEVRKTAFSGITGDVAFDENGDRAANYQLLNAVQEGFTGVLQLVGIISPTTGTIRMENGDDVLWMTGERLSLAPERLMSCNAGMRWDYSIGQCASCPSGFFSEGGQKPSCTPCPPGSTSSEAFGAANCTTCKAGNFSAIGGASCEPCPQGTFSNDEGASACEDCGVGTYINETGSTQCHECGQGKDSKSFFTTMTRLEVDGGAKYSYAIGSVSSERCGCDVDTRLYGGECVECTEGMVCPGLGDITIDEGYYALEDLSVYKCHGDSKRCAGGPAGSTCAEGRTGLTCAECLDEMTPGPAGSCKPCAGDDKGPFIAVCLVALILLFVAYHFIDTQNRATQSHSLLLCALAVGQLVTVTQQLGIVGMLSVQWEDPLKSFIAAFSLLAFNIEVLRLSCVSSVEPLSRYVLKVMVIFFGVCVVVIIHSVFVVIRHHRRFRDRMPILVGALGTLFMVFYISVTSSVLEPLQCQKHPNDKWTVRGYQSIICWDSDQHIAMLSLGSIMFVVVPVAFLAASAYVVRQFPHKMRNGDAAFLKAFSFLFFRFRAQRHQYVLIHLLRSFLLSLVLVFPDAVIQITALNVILLAGFAATLHYLPWRVMHANVLDCLFACLTILLVNLAALYIPDADKNLQGIAELTVSAIIAVLLLVPAAIGYGLWKKFFRRLKPYQFFLCHHKVGSGAWTRLLKMCLLDSGKIKTDVFIDSDNLDNLDNLFDYVGNDTGMLTVVGTQDIFTRPWCVGEMCTAHLKHVNTVVVALPNFKPVDDQFIDDFQAKVSNLEVLIESGMTISMLHETLRWTNTLRRITCPTQVSMKVFTEVVGKLLSKEAAGSIAEPSPLKNSDASVVQVYDTTNTEAAAASFILQKMIVPLLANEFQKIPKPVEGGLIPDRVQMVCVICTNGAFERSGFLQACLRIAELQPMMLPVIAEASFHIPGKDLAERLAENPPKFMGPSDPLIIASVSHNLFKEIGAAFQPGHASEAVLRATASEITKRILLNNRSSGPSTIGSKDMIRREWSFNKADSNQTTPRATDKQKSLNLKDAVFFKEEEVEPQLKQTSELTAAGSSPTPTPPKTAFLDDYGSEGEVVWNSEV